MHALYSDDGATTAGGFEHFGPLSGGVLERMVFNHRPWVLLACALLTAFFAHHLRGLEISASFEQTLPQGHPFIRNYLENRGQLRGLGDSVRIVVENPVGDIFDQRHLKVLQEVNDAVFLLPGVDRAWMKSLYAPVVRWTEVTEEGFVGGPVMPQTYDGSPASIEALRMNITRSGILGSLVANDYRSTAIVVPLLAIDGDGRALDYHLLASSLQAIRQRHESAATTAAGAPPPPPVRIYITGFAMLVGELIDGLHKVSGFFAAAAAIAAALLLWSTRCWRSTTLVVSCSMLAVTWQLGLVAMLGGTLNPFSMLVPFLVFAIGVSHGTQKMNGIMQDTGRGASRELAARCTFRRLFLVGLTALVADAVGFAVLMVVDIPVIRELALSASLGVTALIFTNLVLLPVLLSYAGVSKTAAAHSVSSPGGDTSHLFAVLGSLTERRWAASVIGVAAILGVAAFLVSLGLQVGDFDPGAPELRADSRYNRDIDYVVRHYGASSDVFAAMVKTPREQCGAYENLVEADRLAWTMAQSPGVRKVESLADTIRAYTAGSFDGNPKWQTLSSDQRIIDSQVSNAVSWNSEFVTPDCSLLPVVAYLSDHKAATLDGVATAVTRFAQQHDAAERRFLPAAGNAGIEAATNIVVRQSGMTMLGCVYAGVAILCFIAFRSWRAVAVALLPLLLTSVMAEALMVFLGIGLKVATLPIVALGVGIGVDYSLYLLGVQLGHQRAGAPLFLAWRRSLLFVGKTVGLVGFTLAAGVVTWAWSPIKFQADMGILLTFMFLWNMLAALTLVPALSHFLLPDRGKQAAPDPRWPSIASRSHP